MFKSLSHIVLCLALLLVGVSCGVTRHTPSGSYFLQKVKVEEDRETPKEDRIPAYVFRNYIRQLPNKRFLGTNFYVWAYNLADPDKDNTWNRFKRKIGQEPVYYDETLTQKGVDNLEAYMKTQGFYASSSSFGVDTTSRRKRAMVTYKVNQGAPYIISDIKYEFRDTLIRPLIENDTTTLLNVGEIFSVSTLDKERERIANNLREQGYFNFTVNNIEFVADTLAGDRQVGVTTIIKRFLDGYTTKGEPIMKDNVRYIIDTISVVPDFNPSVVMTDTAYLSRVDTIKYKGINLIHQGEKSTVKGFVLRRAIPIDPYTFYNSDKVALAYKNLMSMGYFKSAKISFQERDSGLADYETISLMGGSLIDSASVVRSPIGLLQCNILCTPALKQSAKIEIEASTTSTFYGLSLTAGYQNRNIFRGAEAFDIDFTTGYEFMKAVDAAKDLATEVGVSTGLSFPRFIVPRFMETWASQHLVQPRTKLGLAINFQDRPYYRRTLSSASIDYSWRSNGYSIYSLRPINVNFIDISELDQDFYESLSNEYLKKSFETQFIAGMTFGYAYNNQPRNLLGNVTVFRFNLETSGNLLSGIEHLFDKPSDEDVYHIFGVPFAQYIRSDLSLSHKIPLGEKCAVAGRIYSGVGFAYGNSTSLPFDRLFYAGGSNSMRGWAPRTLGPGASPEEIDIYYPIQMGDLKFEANLEFRFPIWDNFYGATFFDLGNVWYMNSDNSDYEESIFHLDSFYKQLGFNTGLGIRLDIQFAVLRLDWGVQLHNPNMAVGERWVIKRLDWSYTALNFGVGYPF